MADNDGFSLHVAARCGADERLALEQLCHYITRPALANEWMQTNAAGQVVLKHKTVWRDGTNHLAISLLEFKGLLTQGPLCGSQVRRRYVSVGSGHAGRLPSFLAKMRPLKLCFPEAADRH